MLLITMNEWLGPGRRMNLEQRDRTEVEERTVAFVTALSLGKALESIDAYELAYNERYLLAVNFRLLSVATIPRLTADQIEISRATRVETLSVPPKDT